MAFLITCPNCGPRNAYEFRFGGEVKERPDEKSVSPEQWADYVFFARNHCGPQKEWWFHAKGCGCWFSILRDTSTNLPLKAGEERS